METLKAAVIGGGMMGRHHVRVYSELENAALCGVADANFSAASALAGAHGARAYSDYCEMLAKEKPDLVSIAVPTSLHKKIALDCFGAGCSVLVEKPIAQSGQDAREMIAKADETGLKFMIGHIERFNPVILKLKELLEKKALGKIFRMEADRIGPFPERVRDVGIVVDLAVHDIDIARFVLGCEVTRVFAETQQKIHTQHEDLLCAVMRFENGAVCSLNVNWLTPTKIRKVFVTGEKGMLAADYITQKMTLYENAATTDAGFQSVFEGTAREIEVEKKEPLRAELEHFAECVAKNKEPAVTGTDGLKALEIALAMLESSKKGQSVSL